MFTPDELRAILYLLRRGCAPGMQAKAIEREWDHIRAHRSALVLKVETELERRAA